MDHIKYLGLVIDEKLNWNFQIEKLIDYFIITL